MKRILFSAALLSAVIGSAHAHEIWVETAHTHGGEILKAELGYGDFPELTPIPQDRKHIFSQPLQLVTEKGTENLVQKGTHNYQYQSKKPVAEGSFLVLGTYRPTFWSKNSAGWKQQNMVEMPDAEYCEQTRMYAKNIVNVGHESAGKTVITRPAGQGLEIVPLDNPANIRVGEAFPVKVLFNGEPLPGATLTATFDGFSQPDPKVHKVEAQAFSDTTLDDGSTQIIPLRQGFWKARVVHKSQFPDQKTCQNLASYATLTFQIGHAHH
ncbi:DUF4198 domain-containing protein [Uruburuella testudinis]|uniref:DUF4198 domain-containing protein n=1 Tax=Uruburuella testudinis TaxID=1282863 RepID=A0ABY4DPR8_9NEIS|nr:DUF4198 domain-containing protein [Uruburuella testudinis]UOO81048.1 DUF4198 domain-containing protein [Uruburuella testudinis]